MRANSNVERLIAGFRVNDPFSQSALFWTSSLHEPRAGAIKKRDGIGK
jgi:hypothetical protein